MKGVLLTAIVAMALGVSAWAEGWGDSLQGLYLTVDGGAKVRIYKERDGTFSGKIVWLKERPDRLDVNNPDPARRGDPVLGLVILRGLRTNEDSQRWEDGTIYDPKNGRTYDAYAWRDSGRPDLLRLKGYVLGIKWLGRSTTWTVAMDASL
jgi:uncharacterized protein (DUF2147 family)